VARLMSISSDFLFLSASPVKYQVQMCFAQVTKSAQLRLHNVAYQKSLVHFFHLHKDRIVVVHFSVDV